MNGPGRVPLMNKHLYSAVLAQRENPFIAQGRCGTLSLSFDYRCLCIFTMSTWMAVIIKLYEIFAEPGIYLGSYHLL